MEFLCEVFPSCNQDPLEGLDGQERMHALDAMLQAIKTHIASTLAAVRSPMPRNPPPNSARFDVDMATAESVTGLKGVRKINVAFAADGKALTVPSAMVTDDPAAPTFVYPLIVVSFEVHGPWDQAAMTKPFFASLAGLMRTEHLVYGYSVV